jgi:lipid A 3-O-deacylase
MKVKLISFTIIRFIALICLFLIPFTDIFAKAKVGLCKKSIDGYIVPYVGIFDVFDKRNSALAGIEVRVLGLLENKYFIAPKVGAYVNAKNSIYSYIGFNLDIPLYKDVYLIPGIAVGSYFKGEGKRLGGILGFRSSIELNYKMHNRHRIGISLSHISNANIYKKNPGAEDLVITYSVPFKA